MKAALAPLLSALALMPGVAWGESLTARVWVEGCSDDGALPECRLLWPGGRLVIWDDGATPVELLDLIRQQQTGAALQVLGEFVGTPGPTSEIVLGAVEPVADDPTEPLIAALQGDWQERDGTGRGFSMQGGEWRWAGTDSSGETLMTGFGSSCMAADAGQTVLSLMSDDPGQPTSCLGVTVDGDVLRLTGTESGVFDRMAGQAFDGNGYFLGCDAEGMPIFCYFQSGPLALSLSQDDTDPGLWAEIEGYTTLEPVVLSGILTDRYGASANLTPGQIVKRTGDPYVEQLLAIQGNWQAPSGQPFVGVEITGLDWLETDAQGNLAGYVMEPRPSCAPDMALGQGQRLALGLRAFDDPDAEPRCLEMTGVTADHLTLRDPTTSAAEVTLTRLPDGLELP